MIPLNHPIKQMKSLQHCESRTLILASGSQYRADMLLRLGFKFHTESPNLDETRQKGETPLATARRLAFQKAHAVAMRWPKAVVIGADQVLDFNGEHLGKPGTHDAAVAQLTKLSGRVGVFYSALCVLTPHYRQVCVSQCRATFRRLSQSQIDHYLRREKPYDTAGSAKAESLGIALLTNLSSDDPTSIIGLPLIQLTAMLTRIRMDPLGS